MPRRRSLAVLVLVLGLALAAGACGGGGDGGGGGGGTTEEGAGGAQKGGTFRINAESFEWTGNFDPTGEYLGTAFGIYSNLLIRTLLGYKHVAGTEGNELIPDLAADQPQVSDDLLTWTFKLRDGVKFAPPVNREVTSKDVEYAFKRIGTESLVAQYGFYYTPIKGMSEFTKAGGLSKKGNRISGIETPDDKTIVFHLTEPTGDFGYRIAMPAAGPIPEEVAKCFDKAGEYGRFVVSSGPYMLLGSDKLNIKNCGSMKPLPGFNPNKQLIMVRNPNYDPATDTKEARENFVDRFEITLNTNSKDIFNKIKAGQIEGEQAAVPPEVIREYTKDASLKDNLKIGSGDRTWYITMNLAQPPFDDVHVRKAANWVMDREGLRRARGGSTSGEIANHIVPDTMFNNDLEDYAPYKTAGDAGDLEKAKAEMKQSKYDTNQDGICDAPECKNILHANRSTDIWANMEPVVEQSFKKIGIGLVSREFEDCYPIIQTVPKNTPISSCAGWGKDYADPSTFMVLFDSSSIIREGNVNYSLVGLKPDQAKKLGVKGNINGIPSVDDDIAKCNKLTDDERMTCWEDLDKKLTEEIVPWVPYLDATNIDVISDGVSKYAYDQFSGEMAWAHVAVDPSKQK